MSKLPVGLALLSRKKVVVPTTLLGASTPIVSIPSPFQSPTTGRTPAGVPKTTVIFAAPYTHINDCPSSYVQKYGSQEVDPQVVARELSVDKLVTGSFLRDG